MSKFLNEFKAFAMRGHIIDMAVGIIIGAAFTKIVDSLVNFIIMPPIGKLLGGIDFSNLFINLTDTNVATLQQAKAANIPVIAYGAFFNTLLNFLIIALAVFIVVKQINRFASPKPAEKVQRICPFCKEAVADDAVRCPHCTSKLD